jgi:heme oxygenase
MDYASARCWSGVGGEVRVADLGEQVRSETASLHKRLESLPYFQALHAGALPKVAIVSFLRGLAVVHALLERTLAGVSDPSLARLASHARPKVPLLNADLELVASSGVPSITAAIEHALACAAQTLVQAESPHHLAGVLYVLEGSQRGGLVLRSAYARCLGVSPERLSYFGCYGKDTAAHWQTFVGLLNALPCDAAQVRQVTDAAVLCFEQLASLCAALFPYADTDLRHHVVAVNAEAGDHAMPQDPMEVALALRAGHDAWNQFPYLGLRFGERGLRFTRSDSCWLVALTQMPAETATRSLVWLRSVLASRGIPTVILESHLRAIQAALAAEFPERTEQPARLAPFLAHLQAERETTLTGDEGRARLVCDFDARLGACPGLVIPSAAVLLASAWLDERSGIRGGLAATSDWLTDPLRFSPEWIALVAEYMSRLDAFGFAAC